MGLEDHRDAGDVFRSAVDGVFLLLNQANDQLHAARARAAADVRADVQEAARHVEITSCGGRPCIKLDKRTPTWQSQGSEYIAKAANTFWWMPHPITRHDSGRRPTIDRVNDALGKDRAENVRAVHVPFGDKTLFMHAGKPEGDPAASRAEPDAGESHQARPGANPAAGSGPQMAMGGP
ncbi:hypothetical protein [Xanthomonas cucurbitae]|uniref:hypothetical protein n=1 Tax=Xanthomonas cucurbitae TaxID=56453 RepID=UPI001AD77F50|nr:hypothetical protein [Xanthomonas cucurbitae]